MKRETLYEAFLNCLINKEFKVQADYIAFKGAEFGAKWQKKQMYSEEEVREMLFEAFNYKREECCVTHTIDSIVRKVIEQYKK